MKCFISYSSLDRVIAAWLADYLRDHRYEIWIDQEGIRSAELWEPKIRQALTECNVCIAVITPDAVKSEWVKQELLISQEMNHPIIPLMIRTVAVPDDLQTLGIATIQHIDFFRYGNLQGQQNLLDTLNRIRQANPKTRLQALIVEDIPSQQRDIQELLNGLGIDTTIAGDFDTALEYIQNDSFSFDLVSLDMQLGELDTKGQHGRSLLFQIRGNRGDVPIIILTSLDFPVEEVRNFIVEENVDILQKPFNPRQLRTRVERLLRLN